MEVKNTKENRQKCYCPGCPSYPKLCSGEVLYCSGAIGSSRCDIHARGCQCPTCPVFIENNLREIYWCNRAVVGDANVVMRKKRVDESEDFYQTVVDIKTLAETGESLVRAMGSLKKPTCAPSFENLHFVPAQVSIIPLDREEKVNTETSIGSAAKKPLKVSSPIMISGMSFGATSKNVRLVISKAARNMKIAFNSGEGGILDEEFEAKEFLIGQYATGRFGVNEDVLKKVSAVEIRFGQGAYPGKGSYLPASKMTEEVSRLRGLKTGEPSYSPAHHHDMKTPNQISEKVEWLREITGGVPIGAKIGCGNVEQDIEVLAKAGVDFIAVDGFGGGTGATDAFARDNLGIPLVAAIPRARRSLEILGLKEKISLIAGGNLRTSADFAKCLSLGADAVYIGTAALIAINCQQYRICHTGLCPTGVTTHRPDLTSQINIDEGVRKLCNFIKVTTREMADLARAVGKSDVNAFGLEDLVALHKDLAEICGVKWLGKK